MADLEVTTTLPCGIERAYDLLTSVSTHERAMERYGETVVRAPADDTLAEGDRITRRTGHFGRSVTRTTVVVASTPPLSFREEQVDGPFASFVHAHEFERIDDDHTLVDDRIDYALPWGPLGAVLDRAYISGYLRRVVRERNRKLERLASADEGTGSDGDAGRGGGTRRDDGTGSDGDERSASR